MMQLVEVLKVDSNSCIIVLIYRCLELIRNAMTLNYIAKIKYFLIVEKHFF